MGTGGYRLVRHLTVVTLLAVFTSVMPPVVAHGAPQDASAPASQVARDRLAKEFAAVLSLREAVDSMCLSVMVDDEPIFESQSGTGLVPASLMKVATAAAAIEVMRPDEVYSTEVFARTDVLESITGGVLVGDVFLVGQGDPVLSTPRYAGRYPEPVAHTDITELADRVFATLAARGVKRIEGRVVGDESWFPHTERDYSGESLGEGADPVWKRSFVTANHAGPLSALQLNQGFSRYSWSVSGQGRSRNVRAANPAQHAAAVFDDLLEARGMVITRRPVAGAAPEPGARTMLGTVESPPLSEILNRMLTHSDNTIAEMLLKEVGRRTADSDRASAAASAQTLLRENLGPAAAGLVIADGSGLSYSNRLTCAAVAGLLAGAGPGSPLVEGLAVAGETGTLRGCSPVRSPGGEGQINTVRAKTGSLNHVTALAGTAEAGNGETITFAMIVNKPDAILLGSCNRLHRTLLNAAASYTYGPAASEQSQFVDVIGGPHAAALQALAKRGILDDTECGPDRVCPDEPIRRWTVAVWLVRAVDGSPPTVRATGFEDVDREAWWMPYVERLAALRITRGCAAEPPRYCPDDPVSRGQMASFLMRSFGLEPAPPAGFSDTGAGSHEEAIDALYAAGVTVGCDTNPLRYCPGRPVTRGQMATFIARALGLP